MPDSEEIRIAGKREQKILSDGRTKPISADFPSDVVDDSIDVASLQRFADRVAQLTHPHRPPDGVDRH